MTMTAGHQRSAEPSTVSRTAAATAAKRRIAAERAAVKLAVEQLDALPDRHLLALTETLIRELMRRKIEGKLFE